MSKARHVWALILAGGDGSRLRALTTKPCGTAVPKQFCSLDGSRSLLEDAILRASNLVPPERICTIVAQQHRQWWSENRELARLPHQNLFVQPRNRGTAIGILYSLLHIIAKDPQATVVILPSDHYVREESVLRDAIELALQRVEEGKDQPVLLGVEPDELDTDLGYVLPGGPDPLGGQRVAEFVEKPTVAQASQLVDRGGLWNAFIMVATAQTLLNLFMPRYNAMVMEMQIILSRRLSLGFPAGGWPALVDLYTRLPTLDFSRDILQEKVSSLCVLRVPPCGWSDLGTPRRVGATLQRRRAQAEDSAWGDSDYLNLSAQLAQFERISQLGAPTV
jgi:mannose-1-phosphate guanylyltransferase